MAGTIVVAGLSARALAESAGRAGWDVIALDLFGDADTRRAARRWYSIGDPADCAIDPALLRAALHRAASQSADLLGWVAGSGFEGIPEALDIEVPRLPLLGMTASSVRRVREPESFFATLDRLGLPHPEVSLRPPTNALGWLAKSAAGSGGWHIRPAAGFSGGGAAVYWQRIQPGAPMSALFLADGTRARLVALNRLIVQPLGALPYVYFGAVGPIRDAALAQQVQILLDALVPAFGLRGLASLDFLVDDGTAWLLEINPRPSGTMVLHDAAWPGGLLHAHLQALKGELPGGPPTHPADVRGYRTVHAGQDAQVGPALAAQLAHSPHCHDLPAPGARFGRGEPVCSVSAEAASSEAVLAALDAAAARILHRLSPCEELVP